MASEYITRNPILLVSIINLVGRALSAAVTSTNEEKSYEGREKYSLAVTWDTGALVMQ